MRAFVLVAVLALVATLGESAHGQQLKKSTLSGTVMGNAITIGAVGPVALFTVPPSTAGQFILTQACISNTASNVVLRSVALGRLVVQQGCTTFEPGFPLSPADTLECENLLGGAETCLVSGVLSKK